MPGPGPHLMYTLGVGTGLMHLSKGRFTPYHCLVYTINAFLGPDLGSFSEWLAQTSGVGEAFGSQIMSFVHHPFYYILFLGLPLSVLYSRLSKFLLQKGLFATSIGIWQCLCLITAGCLSHFFLDNLFEENGKTPMMIWILSTGWWKGRAPISQPSVVVVGLLCISLIGLFIYLNRSGTRKPFVTRVWHTFISLGVIAALYSLWCASQIYFPEQPHPAVGEEADLGVLVFLTVFFFFPHGLCVYSMHTIDIIEEREQLPTFHLYERRDLLSM
ncbi:hypothetical protein O6H91_02G019400 [Diphasiastrum complanatum]|uniref:Uncharacterized protein n=1 Tax=Diphasiastrum complanatum TaxID=34168 RepID=A0ACC2EDQ2_DIPCM|nr:hypothetical protein O6H91_02G019400 [Diphasiastrum complanatum]